jgi:hypothetical protein
MGLSHVGLIHHWQIQYLDVLFLTPLSKPDAIALVPFSHAKKNLVEGKNNKGSAS